MIEKTEKRAWRSLSIGMVQRFLTALFAPLLVSCRMLPAFREFTRGESLPFFYENALDQDDELIASLQYEMGVLAFQMGERTRGELCFRQFIRIRKTKGNRIDEGVANALFVLGSLHWAMKKRDDACACWTEALEIFKALGRPDEDSYVKSLTSKLKKAQRRPIARLFRGS